MTPPMNPHQKPQEDVVGLLPCPFCGGKARLHPVIIPFDADCDGIMIQCVACDAIGANVLVDQDVHGICDLPTLEAEAVAAWNTRAPTYEAGRRDMREGWVLVPREATDEMAIASRWFPGSAKKLWSRMLAALPTEPLGGEGMPKP